MSLFYSVIERRLQPELMDQPGLDLHDHHQALRGLERINVLSRTADTLWRSLLQLHRETGNHMRVLDLACGGGDVICRLAREARRSAVPIIFAGCDKSATAIERAKENSLRSGVRIEFFVSDVIRDDLPSEFDVVMCSLFLHHLTESQVESLLAKMAADASRLVLASDLRRTHCGLMLAHMATRLLSRSPIVHFDGPRSVEGAFTCDEVKRLAARAGMEDARVTKCWPQRFLLAWRKR